MKELPFLFKLGSLVCIQQQLHILGIKIKFIMHSHTDNIKKTNKWTCHNEQEIISITLITSAKAFTC